MVGVGRRGLLMLTQMSVNKAPEVPGAKPIGNWGSCKNIQRGCTLKLPHLENASIWWQEQVGKQWYVDGL